MKKIILLSFVFLLTLSAMSQIDQRLNLIIGANKSGLDQLDQSNSQYVYVDWLPITNFERTAALGIFVHGLNNYGRYDVGRYVDETQKLVVGVTGGFMPRRAFYNNDVYFSFNLGYGWGWNKGESLHDFKSKQTQDFLTGSLYGHIFSNYHDWFFRWKFYTSYFQQQSGDIQGFFQDTLLIPRDSLDVWGLNLLNLKLDLDVYKILLGPGDLTMSPKIILGYSNDFFYKEDFVEFGVGLDLFSVYYQNIFEIYYSRKIDFKGKEFDEVGFSINLINLVKELKR